MDFSKRIGKFKKSASFSLDDYFVWCGTLTRGDDGIYYMYFSFWEKKLGFDAWVTHSKIGYAYSSDPFGEMTYGGIALDGTLERGEWRYLTDEEISLLENSNK